MTGSADIYILPPVSEVDFSDSADIAGYAHLLSVASARSSMEKDTGRSSFMNRQVKFAAMNWLVNVEGCIPSLSAGGALEVSDCYDTIRSLAYGHTRYANPLVSRYRMKAFEARIHGDVSVDCYTLQQAITSELDRRTPEFFGQPLRWKSEILDRWHKQFRHGVSLTPESDYDTINRVTLLLSSDLWAFETRNENRFKQKLFENHRHYLDAILDIDTIHNVGSIQNAQCRKHNSEECSLLIANQPITNYSLLIANHSLLAACAPYLSPDEYSSYDSEIRTLLIDSTSTNRFHREALKLNIKYN